MALERLYEVLDLGCILLLFRRWLGFAPLIVDSVLKMLMLLAAMLMLDLQTGLELIQRNVT